MEFIHKIKDSPHYMRLKNSVQYRYDRKQFLVMSAFFAGLFVFFVVMLLPLRGHSAKSDASMTIGLLFLFFVYLPFLLYLAYRWLEIFLYIDSYIFCRVRLDQPHSAGRYGVYFTVEFTDRHGNRLQRDTARMFQSSSEPRLEDYNNQTVLIGYNEESDRVIVIERVNA